MARKRKADHEAVLASALDLFWNEGYAGANTRAIEEKTGLTRFTLQTVYGGKESFFLETLDAYLDNAEANHFPDPDKCDLEGLANWFEHLASPERIPAIDQVGCLAFNSIGAFEPDNDAINQRINRYLKSFEGRAQAIVRREKVRGGFVSDLSAEDAGRILLDLLLGLHGIIKAREDDATARSHALSMANLIRSWVKSTNN